MRIPLLGRLLPGDALGQALPGYRLKIVDEEGRLAGTDLDMASVQR